MKRCPDKTSGNITYEGITYRDKTSGGTKRLAGGDKTSGDITCVGKNVCGTKPPEEHPET